MGIVQRIRELRWHRFLGIVTFSVGAWLTSLFAAYFIPLVLEHPDFANDENGVLDWAALFAFSILGLSCVALSYFLHRQRNWARLGVLGLLLVGCVVMIAVLGSRLIAWQFNTPDEIGEFLMALGFLILPLTMIGFLVNDQVAREFRGVSNSDRTDRAISE